jgi:hypothetical protein
MNALLCSYYIYISQLEERNLEEKKLHLYIELLVCVGMCGLH